VVLGVSFYHFSSTQMRSLCEYLIGMNVLTRLKPNGHVFVRVFRHHYSRKEGVENSVLLRNENILQANLM